MYIVIGSDHAGYELKEHIKKYLSKVDYTICDVGTYTEESCDYPDIADKIRSIESGLDLFKAQLFCDLYVLRNDGLEVL